MPTYRGFRRQKNKGKDIGSERENHGGVKEGAPVQGTSGEKGGEIRGGGGVGETRELS